MRPAPLVPRRPWWLLAALLSAGAGLLLLLLGVGLVVLVLVAGATALLALLARQALLASAVLSGFGAFWLLLAGRQLAMCPELYSGCTAEVVGLPIGAALLVLMGLALGALTFRGTTRN